MNKNIWTISTILIMGMVIPGLGCGSVVNNSPSDAQVSSASVSKPVISITYSGAFTGQTASGYLNLAVNMTIENKGYESFNTSPDNFSVTVDNYSYQVLSKDLQTVDLPSGDKISGKLIFQVPPEAASTRVGYEIEHSGRTLHNIQWIKQAISPDSTLSSGAVVLISYSESFMWVRESRSLYLLIDMTIENSGYESFNTSPEYFTLVMGKILGQDEPTPPISFDGLLSDQRDGAYSNLRSYDLQNGGKLSGRLAFQVPTEIFACTESYRIDYSGLRAYDIQWFKQPPQ